MVDKITIYLSEYLLDNHELIEIDSKNNTIKYESITKSYNPITIKQYIEDIVRIIRYWKDLSSSIEDGNSVEIHVIDSKGNNYEYHINNSYPNNYNTFKNLVDIIKNNISENGDK